MPSEFFCAALSQDRGERICGTAPLVEHWILLEDRGVWNQPSLPDGNLPESSLRWLQNTTARPLLIRQGHRATGPLRCFTVHSREHNPQIRRIHFDHYEELEHLDLETAGELIDTSLFLVCTHGRHDKCCARYGIPLYKALRKTFGLSVWECSHVGGDRFAANLVCFPHGLYYGQLTSEEALTAAHAYLSGHVTLDKYRGRCCYRKPAQLGEFFIRCEHKLTALDSLTLLSTEGVTESRWRVTFATATQTYATEFDQDANQSGYLTCSAAEAKTIRQYRSVELR